ncbi:MAG TPA: PHP domain-containing protein [Clostridiaceae bacterium]|nr:PHP domain-containing protein [Clostridiaceae bacterium]
MKIAVDLHIHSALSPCASEDMTPNNIINMARLKGLDAVAITDHNSSENCASIMKCGEKLGITVIPGMELETAEEVHLICLFPEYQSCMEFNEIVRSRLPDIENREDVFGRQIIMDEWDNITGINNQLLLTASGLSVENAVFHVGKLGGIVIPAHVDRSSYSVLSNLGAIPEGLGFKWLELSRFTSLNEFVSSNPGLVNYKFIKSSDAHELGDMLERETYLTVVRNDAKNIIKRMLEL